MTKKKEKWVCPLCLGYENPPFARNIERYVAMDKLYQAIEEVFLILFYEHLPEDDN